MVMPFTHPKPVLHSTFPDSSTKFSYHNSSPSTFYISNTTPETATNPSTHIASNSQPSLQHQKLKTIHSISRNANPTSNHSITKTEATTQTTTTAPNSQHRKDTKTTTKFT
ncbi:hypothetical protein M758_1G245700 [Ceratodon purpureus]|nr:hypothetical protein M758_1G245700 [Ceratodon purpureus]